MSTDRFHLPRRRASLLAIALTLIGAVGAASLLAVRVPDQAHATPVIGFNPSYIISDNIFTNSQTMSADQIQNFLNSKVPSCDTNGTARASEYGSNLTHAQYAASRGWSGPPYTCLRDFSENGLTSAQIIYNAAQQYQINPQVLIVLLQKEQGLVTDSWPVAGQYRSATGYGCPDTAPCDSQYYGLTNQVSWAAKMYHAVMTKSPTWYSPYTTGNNYIAYNPNSSCGGTTVAIQNLATAALYDYTPYQPNQAALNAGYGSGDSCSAYGNRNFYQYFSDWFGSPQYGNFVRSADNATVYLISGTTKYPINSMATINALYPLGGVTFVSQSYLNGFTTGSLLGRVIRSNNGTVYFYDAGIKLPFGSCDQVADYGSSCGQSVLLEDGQINALVNGPGMTSLYKTTSGKLFYITGGTKREVFDSNALAAAGISGGINVLNEAALGTLPYGVPVTRTNSLVYGRPSGQAYLLSNNTYLKLPASQAGYPYVTSLPTGTLDDASIALGQINTAYNGFVTDTSGSNQYVLLPQGKVRLTTPAQWGVTPTAVDSALLSLVPTASDPVNNGLVMADGNGTVYYVVGGQKRAVPGWGDLLALNITPFTINKIDGAELNAIPTGAFVYPPGRLVKTAGSDTVYIVKNYTQLLSINSFVYPQELGSSLFVETMSDANFASYNVAGSVQTQVACNGQSYIGTNGTLYPLGTSDMAKLGLSAGNFIDAGMVCDTLPKSTQTLPDFLLDGSGTIYLVQSGQKRAFTGYGAYLAHGGAPQNTKRVGSYLTSLIPSGANITQ